MKAWIKSVVVGFGCSSVFGISPMDWAWYRAFGTWVIRITRSQSA